VQCYHVRLGQRRTTVSMDDILSELLSLRLRVAPSNPNSHSKVRQWLQTKLNGSNNPNQKHVSQWLQSEAIKEIAADDLLRSHSEWRRRRRTALARLGRARSRLGRRQRRAGSAAAATRSQPV
jgi:hypothetical protein